MNIYDKPFQTIDVLGIGFGPSNIALAIAHEEMESALDIHFIEGRDTANWHPNMLLQGSDIQNNPLRDLVTPRNPRSKYSFVNYLKCEGRLFDYLNLGLSYPLRKDYARYLSWAAGFFADRVTYGTVARSIRFDSDLGRWIVETTSGLFAARAIVLATGRSRNIPTAFTEVLGEKVFHLCDYLEQINSISPTIGSIAVIGASQSAVEINNDLMARFPRLQIHTIHRSYAMRQKDTSPFSDHIYFPEFVDYYFNRDDAGRSDLRRQSRSTNYSAADLDVLHKLYVSIYEERLDGLSRFHLHNNTEIASAQLDCGGVRLLLRERLLDRATTLEVDAVVLATGFKDLGIGEGHELFPPLLADIAPTLTRRVDGTLDVLRDYRVQSDTGLPVYMNGLCESSHGLGDAGSFSLLSLRSITILESLETCVRFECPTNDPLTRARPF